MVADAPTESPPSVLPDISPSRGEITLPATPRQISEDAERERRMKRMISPLEGEMSGRTEGGAKGSRLSSIGLLSHPVPVGRRISAGDEMFDLALDVAEQ